MSSRKPVIEIDGRAFDTLEGFLRHFSERALSGHKLSRSLDAFNDVLRGGFGTPEDGFVLRWNDHEISRQRLGYAETARQLEERLSSCHPVHRNNVARELEDARRCEGPTVFDWLLEIIRNHGAGGTESEDNVELELR